MSIKKRLIELFESDSKYIQWGYEALSDVLGCKPSSITVNLGKLPEYKKMRPNIVPANYRGDTKWEYQGKNVKPTFTSAPYSKSSSTAAKEKIVDCALSSGIPVYADDVDTVEKHLLNGLSTAHKKNAHLLDRFDRVYTFYHDGCFVVQDRDNNFFASTKLSYEKKYRSYLRKKEKIDCG